MKGKVPLALLKELDPEKNTALRHVIAIDEQGTILSLQGKAFTAHYYFKVLKSENRKSNRGTLLFHLTSFKPKNTGETDSKETWLVLEDVIKALSKWLEIIEGYINAKSVLDDPLLESYADQFYTQFEGLDDTTAQEGLNVNQQLKLDEYLTFVRDKVASLKEGRSADDVAILEEIEADATDLQSNMTKENKGAIAKRLSKLWAKAQRVGLDVIKEIFVNVASEIATKLITGR